MLPKLLPTTQKKKVLKFSEIKTALRAEGKRGHLLQVEAKFIFRKAKDNVTPHDKQHDAERSHQPQQETR